MKSKSIHLVLISSALILSGCPRSREDDSGDFGYQASGTGRSGYPRSHVYHGGSGSSGSPGSVSRTGGSVSSRGGFGGTGHAIAS